MDDSFDGSGSVDAGGVEDAQTVTCRRCDREWDLDAELQTVGNQAYEQFALDHRRHTGHFPDGIATWRVTCRHCPEEAERLEKSAAHRWAETHARHTRHDLDVRHARSDEVTLVEGESSSIE